MRKKGLALLLAVSIFAAALAGCGTYTNDASSGSTSERTVSGSAADESTTESDTESGDSASDISDTVNIAGGVAITLNPFQSQASNDHDIFYLVMSGLVRYYDGEIQMDAAEDYELSDDGLTYTFTLRDGLTYSDGSAITSADFMYYFKRLMASDSGSSECTVYYGVVGAQEYNMGEGEWEAVGISCPDDQTLVFTLNAADGSFINKIALSGIYPITEAFAEEWGDSMGTSPESVLVSGPYVLTEWTVDTSMSFEKNEGWWNADNEFPTQNVNILSIESANTKVSMFENGEIDIISSLDTNYVSTLADYVDSYVGNTEMLLWMNEEGNTDESAALMNNLNFRTALTYALDRAAICGAVSAGYVGTNRAVSSNYPGINEPYVNEYDVDTCPVEGDSELAVEYLNDALAELGYSDVSELPELTFISFERDDLKLLGETMTDSWKQVLGISNITFVQYPIATAIQQFYTGEYDLFMISVGCDVAPTDIMDSFTPDGGYAFFITNWDIDITDLLDEANALEFQSDEYYTKVAELETLFLSEYAIVPLYNQTFFYALADGVNGYVAAGVSYNFQLNRLTVTK